MDLHQIGTVLGSYAQQEQQQSSTTSASTPSSSVSPSTRQHPQHFQQHQHHHQLHNLLPPQPHGSYSPSISSWPHSRNLLHQHQQQQQLYQPQQSNIKREIMGKHLDTGNGSKNADDSMPSTSDFVKKLYKFVPFSLVSPFILFEYRSCFFLPIGFPYVCVGCWKILRFRRLYLGDRRVIVLLSRYVYFFLSLYTFFICFFFFI